ncbi:MAG: 50S ribosomal protein L33 [Patescibacteria group bacterium]|uniref:Large ribosomal subunit protein bL33 n=1 Tax=candidate division WWE3 bacterium TaxID=2053526 RepID=A0A955EBC1_UNCKA|nr:50S ribosomal protein L33 [candidate division WWE3 bacterium]
MAKKSNRLLVGLQCTVCGAVNYVSQRNKVNTTDKLGLNKFCKVCRKHLPHKEKPKL